MKHKTGYLNTMGFPSKRKSVCRTTMCPSLGLKKNPYEVPLNNGTLCIAKAPYPTAKLKYVLMWPQRLMRKEKQYLGKREA